jgi:hypothetical protein
MSKIIKLTETDLVKIIKKVIVESHFDMEGFDLIKTQDVNGIQVRLYRQKHPDKGFDLFFYVIPNPNKESKNKYMIKVVALYGQKIKLDLTMDLYEKEWMGVGSNLGRIISNFVDAASFKMGYDGLSPLQD